MTTKTYTPAIITKANRKIKDLKFEVVFWRYVHKVDKKRIKEINTINHSFYHTLDVLENGFIYGGKK